PLKFVTLRRPRPGAPRAAKLPPLRDCPIQPQRKKRWTMHKTPTIREVVTAVVVVLLAGSAPREGVAQSAWQTLTTDHFEIYYERQAVDSLDRVAVEAERAYGRLAMDFRYDLAERVPLILL